LNSAVQVGSKKFCGAPLTPYMGVGRIFSGGQ